jgi:hypothetical protein
MPSADYKRAASLTFGRRPSMSKSWNLEPTIIVGSSVQMDPRNVPKSAVLQCLQKSKVGKTSVLAELSNLGENGDEEDGVDDEDDAQSPASTLKGRRMQKLLVYAQAILGLCLIGQIVLIWLFSPNTTVAGLEYWKCSILLLTLLSGRFIAKVVVYGAIFMLELTFKDNGKLIYVAYGVKTSAWNVLWCAQVLSVWMVLFNKQKQSVRGITIKFNEVLICTQIATLIMIAKVIFIKLLANSFHRTAYFERIRDALFDHYAIERLSLPAYMMKVSKRVEEESATGGIRGMPEEEFGIPEDLSPNKLGVRTFQNIMRFV